MKCLIEGEKCRTLWDDPDFVNCLFKTDAPNPVCHKDIAIDLLELCAISLIFFFRKTRIGTL